VWSAASAAIFEPIRSATAETKAFILNPPLQST
jgi:hypothetical protein